MLKKPTRFWLIAAQRQPIFTKDKCFQIVFWQVVEKVKVQSSITRLFKFKNL